MTFRRWPTLIAIAAAAVALLFLARFRPSIIREREPAYRVKSASKLKQIGHAMLLYANENAQASADSFVTLLRTQDLVPEVFVCPTTEARPAASVDAFAADPGPAHCSYVYLADRLPMPFDALPPLAILAMEREPVPSFGGVNVLFGDGHVEFYGVAPPGKPTPW